MAHTSAFCLAQEALHRERAVAANLDNVRIVAASAAAAWAREAVVALRREGQLGREDRRLGHLVVIIDRDFGRRLVG